LLITAIIANRKRITKQEREVLTSDGEPIGFTCLCPATVDVPILYVLYGGYGLPVLYRGYGFVGVDEVTLVRGSRVHSVPLTAVRSFRGRTTGREQCADLCGSLKNKDLRRVGLEKKLFIIIFSELAFMAIFVRYKLTNFTLYSTKYMMM